MNDYSNGFQEGGIPHTYPAGTSGYSPTSPPSSSSSSSTSSSSSPTSSSSLSTSSSSSSGSPTQPLFEMLAHSQTAPSTLHAIPEQAPSRTVPLTIASAGIAVLIGSLIMHKDMIPVREVYNRPDVVALIGSLLIMTAAVQWQARSSGLSRENISTFITSYHATEGEGAQNALIEQFSARAVSMFPSIVDRNSANSLIQSKINNILLNRGLSFEQKQEIITNSLELLKHNTDTLIQRVAHDKQDIESQFFGGRSSNLVEVEITPGETHRGGKSPCFLSFQVDGMPEIQRIVYKPRDIRVDALICGTT